MLLSVRKGEPSCRPVTHHSVQTPRQYRMTPVMAINVYTLARTSKRRSSRACLTASLTASPTAC